MPRQRESAAFAASDGAQTLVVTKRKGEIRFRAHIARPCDRVVIGVAKENRSDLGTEEDVDPAGTLQTVDEFILDDRAKDLWVAVRIEADHWGWARVIEAEPKAPRCLFDQRALMRRVPGDVDAP